VVYKSQVKGFKKREYMNKSLVKFSTVKFDKLDKEATLPAKFIRMLQSIPLKEMVEGKTVALKMHLGGDLGYTTIHPLFVKIMVDALQNAGGKIFITDLYHLNNDNFGIGGARDRGYSSDILGVPFLPVAGNADKYFYTKKLEFKTLKEFYIAGNIHDAEVLIDFSHVKGHGVCGYGGALKNIAMGCVTQKTRRDLHALEGGIEWDEDLCDQCETCIEECRYKANKFNEEGKYEIFYHHCTYCQHCVEVCPKDSLTFSSRGFIDFQKGMALVTREVLSTFDKEKVYYINVLLNITMLCDCWGFSTPSLVPDIGIMASDDIAAIEKASLDVIKSEYLLPDSLPTGRELREGNHLFEKIFGKDPYGQVRILDEMKIGSSDYEFEEIV
jgi:uncharacterized Fe-S center protein